MKAVVDDTCVACGLCPEICPEVFKLEGQIAEVIVDVVLPGAEGAARLHVRPANIPVVIACALRMW